MSKVILAVLIEFAWSLLLIVPLSIIFYGAAYLGGAAGRDLATIQMIKKNPDFLTLLALEKYRFSNLQCPICGRSDGYLFTEPPPAEGVVDPAMDFFPEQRGGS